MLDVPHTDRGGKCSIFEGGTKGIAIVNSPLISNVNVTYHGLAHAVDWLPSLVTGALGGSTVGTKPLDGHDLWAALLCVYLLLFISRLILSPFPIFLLFCKTGRMKIFSPLNVSQTLASARLDSASRPLA